MESRRNLCGAARDGGKKRVCTCPHHPLNKKNNKQKGETRCASLHESKNVKYPPHYVVIMLHKRMLLFLTLLCASSDAFLALVARQRRGPQSCSKAKVRNTVHLCTDEHPPDFSLGENKRSIPPLELVSLGMSGATAWSLWCYRTPPDKRSHRQFE